MNQTADFVAEKYGISRQALDEYVVMSHKRGSKRRARRANTPRRSRRSRRTMKVTDKATNESKMVDVTLDHDEGPRPDTTLERLAKLKPVYEGGTTTAGNASQLSDGAAAVVMMDAELAAKRGLADPWAYSAACSWARWRRRK